MCEQLKFYWVLCKQNCFYMQDKLLLDILLQVRKDIAVVCLYICSRRALVWIDHKGYHQGRPNKDSSNNRSTTNNKTKEYIVIPYVQGLCKSRKHICIKYDINTYFMRNSAIKNILVSPKDKDPVHNKSCIIYQYKCNRVDCNKVYIGKYGRTFGERYKEYLRAPLLIQSHQTATGYLTTMENFNIIGREEHAFSRTLKESIYIRVNQPTLNRNIGKYNLPHIWNGVLIKTQKLQIKHIQHLKVKANITSTTWNIYKDRQQLHPLRSEDVRQLVQ